MITHLVFVQKFEDKKNHHHQQQQNNNNKHQKEPRVMVVLFMTFPRYLYFFYAKDSDN